MTHQELKFKSLKVILLSQLLIEANDDIKGSTLYKGKLKVFGKQYINQLGTAIRQTDAIYEENATMYTNLTKNLEQLVEKLTHCSTQDLVMINQIHEHYKDNKTDWDSVFGVEMQALNN